MALQNFVDRAAPVISAAWLNQVDILKETVFAAAATKSTARTALTSDLPLEIVNGGTAGRTAAAAAAALGVPTLAGPNTIPATNTFSGVNTFSNNNVFSGVNSVASAEPRWLFNETDAAADKKVWDIDVNSSIFKIRTRTDADGVGKDIFTATRGATTLLASIDIGNATDLAPVALRGASTMYETTLAVNAQKTVLTQDSGSFTGTLTGMTAGTTGTINWFRNGKLITMYAAAAISGTSNATTMTMTGVPANLVPATDALIYPCINLQNNGLTNIVGAVSMFGAVLTFYLSSGVSPIQVLSTGFTNSGTKGVQPGVIITYLVP